MVVRLVLLTVFSERGVDLSFQRVESSAGWPRYKEWADLGADEVIGATRAEVGQFSRVGRVDELQNIIGVAEACDPAILRAHTPAEVGDDFRCEMLALRARGDGFTSKANGAFRFAVTGDKLADLIDDGERVDVALALRIAPGEKTWPPRTMPSQSGLS